MKVGDTWTGCGLIQLEEVVFTKPGAMAGFKRGLWELLVVRKPCEVSQMCIHKALAGPFCSG